MIRQQQHHHHHHHMVFLEWPKQQRYKEDHYSQSKYEHCMHLKLRRQFYYARTQHYFSIKRHTSYRNQLRVDTASVKHRCACFYGPCSVYTSSITDIETATMTESNTHSTTPGCLHSDTGYQLIPTLASSATESEPRQLQRFACPPLPYQPASPCTDLPPLGPCSRSS